MSQSNQGIAVAEVEDRFATLYGEIDGLYSKTQHLAGVLRNDLISLAKKQRDRELDNIDSMDWSENDDE